MSHDSFSSRVHIQVSESFFFSPFLLQVSPLFALPTLRLVVQWSSFNLIGYNLTTARLNTFVSTPTSLTCFRVNRYRYQAKDRRFTSKKRQLTTLESQLLLQVSCLCSVTVRSSGTYSSRPLEWKRGKETVSFQGVFCQYPPVWRLCTFRPCRVSQKRMMFSLYYIYYIWMCRSYVRSLNHPLLVFQSLVWENPHLKTIRLVSKDSSVCLFWQQ